MTSPPSKVESWIRVLYDYKYTTRDGQEVTITKDEKLILLAKTNTDWWHAQRVTENKPLFVPANHVEEILSTEDKISTAQEKQTNESDNSATGPKEEKRNHDSFRNVIRKLSGNMNQVTKPTKAVKLTKKNSMNSHDEKPTKVKDMASETSTFAKCFGKDMKNSDSRPQNRFQEELESALVNRCQRNVVFSSKLNDQIEHKINSERQRSPVPELPVPQQKLDKPAHKQLPENKPRNIESLTKELESKVQQKYPKFEGEDSWSYETQSILKKAVAERRSKLKIELPKPHNDEREIEKVRVEKSESEKAESECIQKTDLKKKERDVLKKPEVVAVVSEMDDEAILRDKRKMWAIERLMAELMRSSERKMPTVDEEKVQPEKDEGVERSSSKEKSIFDFCVSPSSVGPKSVAKKSPKILDEYNEANILNEDEADEQKKLNYEKPSYSSVPVKARKRSSSSIKVKLKNSRGELQLTPSLEKLASEIQFIPANKVAVSRQCSKSDTALNEFNPPKMIPKTFGSLDKGSDSKRAVKPKRLDIFSRKLSFAMNKDKMSKQLKRKTRSLDDLNLAEEDVSNNNNNNNADARDERRKPMQLFKSADSLKKGTTKPVPAKRKVFDVLDMSVRSKAPLSGSCENIRSGQKWPIDLERSTAVGFKALLRTSDSGSEEFLQNKTFPNVEDQGSKYSSSNDNLYENFNSGEMILSSIDSGQSIVADNVVQLPQGWKQQIDLKTRQPCYVNEYGDKWFSSNDSEGKIYFFEQNSNKSSWALPAVKQTSAETKRRNSIDNNMKAIKQLDESPESVQDFKLNNWPQLLQGNMCILKEGFLNRTKITEHGKKLKKCWSTSYAVLTELFLLIFRDERVFSLMKMGYLSTSKPDISVDLNGASIESGEKFSSRRNVFLINTIFGLQVLIQSDNSVQSGEWYQQIKNAIKALPSGRDHGKCVYEE